MEKDGKKKSQHLGFLSHNILGFATLKVYKKFEDSHRSREKAVKENLIGEKEKWTNKGNGKHQEADSLLHNATSHTQHLYPNLKILGAVVPEKSLTQISLCITLE